MLCSIYISLIFAVCVDKDKGGDLFGADSVGDAESFGNCFELESSRGWCGGQEGRWKQYPSIKYLFWTGLVFLSWTYVASYEWQDIFIQKISEDFNSNHNSQSFAFA